MSKLFIRSKNLFALVFLGIFLSAPAQSKPSSYALKANEGYVALRMTSNGDFWQYLYYKNAGKTAMQTFFSSQTRFKYSGDTNLKLVAVPAGRYYWSSFYTSGGAGTTFPTKYYFKVHSGKINYLGDIKFQFGSDKRQVSFSVANRAGAAKKEIQSKQPGISRKYRFVSHITRLK